MRSQNLWQYYTHYYYSLQSFNSLYEILEHLKLLKTINDDASFNSLYEIHRYKYVGVVDPTAISFNSLYEIHLRHSNKGLPECGGLSILFMRFHKHTIFTLIKNQNTFNSLYEILSEKPWPI